MEANVFRTACPKDCRDTCAVLVEVRGGVVTGVRGDPDHEITRGFICPKARYEIDRLYSPQRLLHPMIKKDGGWVRASWEEALDLVAEKMARYREKYGTLSVMHISDKGTMGLLNDLEERFFNLFGGVTVTRGSLCSATGTAAQIFDFGACLAHDPVDVLNSKTIIIWGRNPAYTNIHFLPILKEARSKGAYVALVDPAPTSTVPFCDLHLAPRPGTDGALALGMAHVILGESLEDRDFIKNRVLGFPEFQKMVWEYSPGRVAGITGLAEGDIRALALRYASEKPAGIHMGFGLQRYGNSGSTVRAIDALAAITGNIGVPGGGANYSNSYFSKSLRPDILAGEKAVQTRSFPKPAAARYILQADDPPVKMLFITRANPMTQMPDTRLVQQAIKSVEFKVSIDLEMTESALMADVVLPCTTFFEQENILTAWGHNYITYGERSIPPLGEARDDWEIFAGLARCLGFGEEYGEAGHWLEILLRPFLSPGIRPQDVRGKSFRIPGAPYVSWADGVFKTPSGKYELYSQSAEKRGFDPLPSYRESDESTATPSESPGEYPFYLLSPAHSRSIHSQFYENVEPGDLPVVHLGAEPAGKKGILDGSPVLVVSPRGSLTCRARIHDDFRSDVVLIYCGGSMKDGKAVNVLTPDRYTKMGNCATYFDCLCDVRPLSV